MVFYIMITSTPELLIDGLQKIQKSFSTEYYRS